MEHTTEKPFVFLFDKVLDYCLDLVNKNYDIEQIENALKPIRHCFDDYKYDALIGYIIQGKDSKIANQTYSYKGRKYPEFELIEVLKRREVPKPAYLLDEKLHPSVRNFFEALYQKLPEYPAFLNLPCSEEDLLLIEQTFEVELPKAFKDFYRITDGLMEEFIMNETFYNLQTIVKECSNRDGYAETGGTFTNPSDEDVVQPYYHHKKWLIFGETPGCGDCYAIDFAPAAKGTWGQILAIYDTTTYLCQSFEQMLNNITKYTLQQEDFMPVLYHYVSSPYQNIPIIYSNWKLSWEDEDNHNFSFSRLFNFPD